MNRPMQSGRVDYDLIRRNSIIASCITAFGVLLFILSTYISASRINSLKKEHDQLKLEAADMQLLIEQYTEKIRTIQARIDLLENIESRIQEGLNLRFSRRYDEAIAVFQSILDSYPKNSVALIYISYCYFKKGNYEESIRFAKLARQNLPNNNVSAFRTLALANFGAGDIEQALKYVRVLLEIRMDFVQRIRYEGDFRDFARNARLRSLLKSYEELVRELQRLLRDLGFYLGEVDSIYGYDTDKAIEAYCNANNINHFEIGASDLLEHVRENYKKLVREIQEELRAKGYYSYRIDGDYGPRTRSAVATFLRENGVTAARGISKSEVLKSLQGSL